MDIAHLREEYRKARLDERDVSDDPLEQFQRWFGDAQRAELPEPNAMALATADASGKPNCRMVLLKEADRRGLTFYTDYRSTKAKELAGNALATLCFFWNVLERQVRIHGRVERVSTEESAAYFRQRPRGSRLGAWASTQSAVLPSRETLEQAHAAMESQYPGEMVPLPEHWGGYRVIPVEYEFWQGRPDRLHDRIRYRLHARQWEIERLSP